MGLYRDLYAESKSFVWVFMHVLFNIFVSTDMPWYMHEMAHHYKPYIMRHRGLYTLMNEGFERHHVQIAEQMIHSTHGGGVEIFTLQPPKTLPPLGRAHKPTLSSEELLLNPKL